MFKVMRGNTTKTERLRVPLREKNCSHRIIPRGFLVAESVNFPSSVFRRGDTDAFVIQVDRPDVSSSRPHVCGICLPPKMKMA